jgi:hypothetical protein
MKEEQEHIIYALPLTEGLERGQRKCTVNAQYQILMHYPLLG